MVYQIIYSSAISENVSGDDIIAIAKHAYEKNKQIDVTGMMVCHQGSIMQVLEGEQSIVDELYAKISADERHKHILLLIARETDHREFEDWAMGFKHIPDDFKDPAVTALSAKTYKNILPEDASQAVKSISRSFARVNQIC